MLISMTTYDTPENKRAAYTEKSFWSVVNSVDTKRHRMFVSDNGSTDPRTLRLLVELDGYDWVTVLRNGSNLGPAKATNQSWKRRKPGEHCCKVDNDVLIHSNHWADDIEEVLQRDESYGIVGLKRKDLTQRPDHPESVWRSKLVMLPGKRGDRWLVVEQAEDIIGTCVVFNSKLLDKIGYLYNAGLKYGFEDPLACHRAHKAGFKTAFYPSVEIEHIDPGGDAHCDWKQQYAADHWADYQRWVCDMQLYHGPEDD